MGCQTNEAQDQCVVGPVDRRTSGMYGKIYYTGRIYRGYPAKSALSAMRKHGG